MMARPGRRFAYQLAARLGWVNVDAMLREISATQIAEWEAFFLLEPWGSEVEAFRTGQVCAAIGNFAGKTLKEGMTLSPSDFMPRRAEKAEPALEDKLKGLFGVNKAEA